MLLVRSDHSWNNRLKVDTGDYIGGVKGTRVQNRLNIGSAIGEYIRYPVPQAFVIVCPMQCACIWQNIQ